MTAGDLALAALSQADGATKLRPVQLLKRLPPFGDFLVCGVSSQVHQEVVGFDHLIAAGTLEFASTGLKVTSLFRLGFLAVIPESHLAGKVGRISDATRGLLLRRLGDFLVSP
jgi:mRNA interferase MazF